MGVTGTGTELRGVQSLRGHANLIGRLPTVLPCSKGFTVISRVVVVILLLRGTTYVHIAPHYLFYFEKDSIKLRPRLFLQTYFAALLQRCNERQ